MSEMFGGVYWEGQGNGVIECRGGGVRVGGGKEKEIQQQRWGFGRWTE